MFAGSCVGVICLVVLLEFLRRLAREYDAFLIREFQQRHASLSSGATSANASVSTSKPERDSTEAKWSNVALRKLNHPGTVKQAAQFRPNFIQQAMRAHLHMLQFAVAYFIMLLAMYYNGYILISIFIGAYIGSFVFSWQTIAIADVGSQGEATVCCG